MYYNCTVCFCTCIEYDGLFLSNGPGDPSMCKETVENIKTALQKDKPVFGICLGHQLLSRAAGCQTFKLKYSSITLIRLVLLTVYHHG